MSRLEMVSLIIVAASMAGLCALGWLYYDYSKLVLRFPLIVAGTMFVVISTRLIALLRASETTKRAEPVATDNDVVEAGFKHGWGHASLWLVAVLPSVALLGYPLGLAAYALVYTKSHDRSWRMAFALAAGIFAVAYFVFVKALLVPLPVLPFWLEDRFLP